MARAAARRLATLLAAALLGSACLLPAASAATAGAGAAAQAAMKKPGRGQAAVLCHYTYGGEDYALTARSTHTPYEVKPVQVGSYFLFKLVFQDQPKDLASIKIYVYADEDPVFRPIHHATYRYPLGPSARGRWGFTGMQRVYEPHRDGELEYWCEMSSGGTP